jgi:hypothetical protein
LIPLDYWLHTSRHLTNNTHNELTKKQQKKKKTMTLKLKLFSISFKHHTLAKESSVATKKHVGV